MISPASPRSPVVPFEPVESFTWSCAGAPIRIVIPLTLISRLRAVANGPDPDSARQSEVGGFLLGAQGTSSGTVEIRDCVRIARSRAADGHYALDPFELAELRREKSSLQGLQVVGYFRTQALGDPRLRSDELRLVRKCFPDPSSVVLLTQTSVAPYRGGFLFWSRNVFLPASLRDFPFDVDVLAEKAKANPSQETVIKRKAPSRLRSAMAASIGLALITFTALVMRGRWFPGLEYAYAKAPKAVVSTEVIPPRVVPLQLVRLGSEIDVRWNPGAFKTAREGRMEIREELQPARVFPLDRERLAGGHFRYRSPAQRLAFFLEVIEETGPVVKGAALAVSSVRLDPPGFTEPAGNPVVLPSAVTRQIVEPHAAGTHVAAPPPVPQPVQITEESPKTILSPAPELQSVEQQTIKPVAAVAELRQTSPEPAPKTGFGPVARETPSQSLAAHLPAVAHLPVLAPPAKPLVFHPPVATHTVQPVIGPELADRMLPGAEIQVLVNTHVNAAGRVVDARALPNPLGSESSALYARLGLAATDAAMLWEFDPALVGTTPVLAKHTIRFVFKKPAIHASRSEASH